MKEQVTTIQIRVTTRKKLRVVTSFSDETYDEWIIRKAEEEIKAHEQRASSLSTRWKEGEEEFFEHMDKRHKDS